MRPHREGDISDVNGDSMMFVPSEPMYMWYVLRVCDMKVIIFTASPTQAADTIALVLATAGIIFLTTPIVSI